MERRGFLCIAGLAAAGLWLGVKGLFGAGAGGRLKEAAYYRKLD